mmetsp:Transcript_38198/g.46603  ORF Transcript_38198/g.46603 Transcript_38198/m.46603 type:complete len:96 (-) Transcript_38198:152-439(-)
MPVKPTHNRSVAHIAPSTLFTRSLNINIPQQNEVITINDDQTPTLIAKPALRIAKIPAVPPGHQNTPDSIPHGVKARGSPSGTTRKLYRNSIVTL